MRKKCAKGECNLSTTKKSLNDLTLLNRFLFAEAVEDPEIMQLILEIILGQEIRLDSLPQTEKETRNSPLYRHIRLDVWARDRYTFRMCCMENRETIRQIAEDLSLERV